MSLQREKKFKKINTEIKRIYILLNLREDLVEDCEDDEGTKTPVLCR